MFNMDTIDGSQSQYNCGMPLFLDVIRNKMDQMQLQPKHPGNEHFKLLNQFGVSGQIISNKKFFDTNHQNCIDKNSQTKPHMDSSMGTGYKTERKPDIPIPNCFVNSSSSRPPKKMKRNKMQCDKINVHSKSKKPHKFVKQSKRECNRNILMWKSVMKPKKNKAWHKKSLKIEITELSEPPWEETIESPIITQICIQTPPIAVLPLQSYPRTKLPSECESEDSFIVFEENSDDESELSDTSCDDDSECSTDTNDLVEIERPVKKVRFADDKELCKVHPMVQWSFAYHKARKGPWEQFALDRSRFQSRINNIAPVLNVILEAPHRAKIYKERFMEKN